LRILHHKLSLVSLYSKNVANLQKCANSAYFQQTGFSPNECFIFATSISFLIQNLKEKGKKIFAPAEKKFPVFYDLHLTAFVLSTTLDCLSKKLA